MRRALMRVTAIARREYVTYLKTAGFWISLLVAPLILGFSLLGGPQALRSTAPPPTLSILDLSHADLTTALRPLLSGPSPIARLVPPPPAEDASLRAADAAMARAVAARDGPDLGVVVHGPPGDLVLDLFSRGGGQAGLAAEVQSIAATRMGEARLAARGLPPGLLREVVDAAPQVRRPALAETAALRPTTASPPASPSDGAALPAPAAATQTVPPAALALGAGFLLWMTVVTGAGLLLNSVIEEKAGRILEVLMSCASIPEILAGKILGVAALSGTVLLVWAGFAAGLLSRTSPGALGAVATTLSSHGLVLLLLAFFVGGYLMYASVFAAIGAFCETTRDAQTLLGPLMMLLTVPVLFLGLAGDRPDAPVVAILSWLPPFTPFMMAARAAAGLPAWQTALAIVEMAATATLVVAFAGRAFAAGALSGGRLDWRTLVRGAVRGGG